MTEELTDYQKVHDFNNLYRAYKEARKGKRNKQTVAKFETNLLEAIYYLSYLLETKTYTSSPYYSFYVYEPKKRLVKTNAFKDKVESIGYQLSNEELETGFAYFKELCDKKKDVSDGDIEALILDRVLSFIPEKTYVLKDYAVYVGTGSKPTASVTLTSGDIEHTEASVGNGPVDAAYNAIKKILGFSPQLKGFRIGATSEHSDALGETRVVLHHGGVQSQGRGTSTDVIESSIRAYVDALNRLYATAAAREIKLDA